MEKKPIKRRYWILGSIVAICLSYIVFSDGIIKSMLQKQLGNMHGAQVDIGKFTHSLFPLSFEINDIEFTNAESPNNNKIEMRVIESDLTWGALLSGRIEINQMSILDVAFNQPREYEGDVYRTPEEKSEFSWDELALSAKEALPSTDELIAHSPLKSAEAANNAVLSYEKHAESLASQYAALPSETKLAEYKSEIEKLQNKNYKKDPAALLEAKEALEQIKASMKQDRKAIKAFTSSAKIAQTELSENLKQLREAKKADIALIKNLINGDEAALAHVTQMLFGEEIAKYNQYLVEGMQFLLPLISGEQSPQEIPEEDDEPSPSTKPKFTVHNADVSLNWEGNAFSSNWKNITSNHSLLGEATSFTATTLEGSIQTFLAKGNFWYDQNGFDASQSWELASLALENVTLSQQERLDAALKEALLSLVGTFTIEDNELKGESEFDFTELVLSASSDDDIGSTIASALNKLDALTMKVDLDGSIFSPNFSISSDLDSQLSQAALSNFTESQQARLDDVTTKLQSMVGDEEQLLSGKLNDIDSWTSIAQGENKQLNELLKSSLNNIVDKKKDKLLEKLKGKLGDISD